MKDNSVSQKAPYVKLIKDGTELSMPPHLFLTDASKEILRKGADGQGFIYFVNVTTGEIHLLAANNPEKQVTIHLPNQDRSQDNDAKSALQDEYKKNLYKLEVEYSEYAKLSEQPDNTNRTKKLEDSNVKIKKLQLELEEIQKKLSELPTKKLDTTTSMPISTIPVDRDNKPYKAGEYAITRREKTTQTGASGGGGGDLHAYGERVLKLGGENLLAGGFWIRREGEVLSFSEFRTRSTANTKLTQFNPLYRMYFNSVITEGHLEGHSQVYVREIPQRYLIPIVNAFSQEAIEIYQQTQSEDIDVFSKKVKDSFDMTIKHDEIASGDPNKVIPLSTRIHLGKETSWLNLTDSDRLLLKLSDFWSLLGGASYLKSDFKNYIQAIYDENFPENRALIPLLLEDIKKNRYNSNTQRFIEVYQHILHEALKINPNDQHAWETLDVLNDCVPIKLKDETLLRTPEDVYNKLDSMSKNPVIGTEEIYDFIHVIYLARANEKRSFLPQIVRYIELHKKEGVTQKLFEIFKQISAEVLANNPHEENYLERLLNNPEVKYHNQNGDKFLQMFLDSTDQNYKSNFLNTSLSSYEEALKIEPDNLYALNKLADVNDILKKYSEAIKYREMALEAEMKSQPNVDKTSLESYKKLVDAYNKQADEYYKNYQFEAAIDNYNSALKLDPSNANAQSGIRLSSVWKKTTSFYKTTLGLFESVGLKKPSAPASEDKNIQEADQSKTQHHQQKK